MTDNEPMPVLFGDAMPADAVHNIVVPRACAVHPSSYEQQVARVGAMWNEAVRRQRAGQRSAAGKEPVEPKPEPAAAAPKQLPSAMFKGRAMADLAVTFPTKHKSRKNLVWPTSFVAPEYTRDLDHTRSWYVQSEDGYFEARHMGTGVDYVWGRIDGPIRATTASAYESFLLLCAR